MSIFKNSGLGMSNQTIEPRYFWDLYATERLYDLIIKFKKKTITLELKTIFEKITEQSALKDKLSINDVEAIIIDRKSSNLKKINMAVITKSEIKYPTINRCVTVAASVFWNLILLEQNITFEFYLEKNLDYSQFDEDKIILFATNNFIEKINQKSVFVNTLEWKETPYGKLFGTIKI